MNGYMVIDMKNDIPHTHIFITYLRKYSLVGHQDGC